MTTAVIYEGPAGRRVEAPDLSITGAPREDLVEVARERVTAGADRIELCGGLGVRDAAEVTAALGPDVEVGLNRYDFDSLEAITRYKTAFGSGAPTRELFVYRSEGADPDRDRVEHGSTTFVGVPDAGAVGAVAAELRGTALGLIELYGGLGSDAAAAAARATDGEVPVGFVG